MLQSSANAVQLHSQDFVVPETRVPVECSHGLNLLQLELPPTQHHAPVVGCKQRGPWVSQESWRIVEFERSVLNPEHLETTQCRVSAIETLVLPCISLPLVFTANQFPVQTQNIVVDWLSPCGATIPHTTEERLALLRWLYYGASLIRIEIKGFLVPLARRRH